LPWLFSSAPSPKAVLFVALCAGCRNAKPVRREIRIKERVFVFMDRFCLFCSPHGNDKVIYEIKLTANS
jgi:hypothetical protein